MGENHGVLCTRGAFDNSNSICNVVEFADCNNGRVGFYTGRRNAAQSFSAPVEFHRFPLNVILNEGKDLLFFSCAGKQILRRTAPQNDMAFVNVRPHGVA